MNKRETGVMLWTRRHPVILRVSRRRLIDEVYSFCLESHNHIYNISVPDDFTCNSDLMNDAIEVMKQEKVLRCVAEHLDVSWRAIRFPLLISGNKDKGIIIIK